MEHTPRSKATRNGGSAWLVTAALAVASAGLGHAGDGTELGASNAVLTAARPAAPWSRASMDSTTRSKLETAFALAMSRVKDTPECSELFAQLGADGAEMLATSLYFPAPPAQRASTCRRAVAYTHLGSVSTFLCRDFGSLTDDHAALVLVHEALHHSGLSENTVDPLGMSSPAINELVRKACRFEVFKKGGRAG